MALSFLKGRKVGAPPKLSSSNKGDPLQSAKMKIIGGIEAQQKLVTRVIAGEPLPRGEGGRMQSTWFYREVDGIYWTTLRYGQIPIPLDGDKTAVNIGKIEELNSFYSSVIDGIRAGELDSQISTLQKKRSDALRGVKRSAAGEAPQKRGARAKVGAE